MKKLINMVVFAVCLVVFLFSIYKIYQYLIEANDSKDTNDKLREKAVSQVPKDSEETKKSLPINIDFSVLKQENEDIIGWIYSENSPINYPILQSNDNQYYLRRLVNRKYNRSGSIFMDYRNNSNFTDNSTIIYGHNMKNNKMFGILENYKKQEYYDKHKTIYLFTPEYNYIIRLVAGFTTSTESDIYNLSEMNQDRKNEIIKQSDFKSDVTVEDIDKVVILSTCSYDYENARYIVIGDLNKIE